MEHAAPANFRIYWTTWAVLLGLTVTMLLLDSASISRTLLVGLMVTAMVVKASLIAGNFMHLRSEQWGIVLTVIVGLFVCGLVLYALIAPDAARIHDMVNGPTR